MRYARFRGTPGSSLAGKVLAFALVGMRHGEGIFVAGRKNRDVFGRVGMYYDKMARIDAIDLHTGKLSIKERQNTVCFFIVENFNDMEKIRQIAMELILSGCVKFHFWGKQEALWCSAFDRMGNQIHPNCKEKDAPRIKRYASLDEFAEALGACASNRTFLPQNIVLLYDDGGSYQRIKALCAKKRR